MRSVVFLVGFFLGVKVEGEGEQRNWRFLRGEGEQWKILVIEN